MKLKHWQKNWEKFDRSSIRISLLPACRIECHPEPFDKLRAGFVEGRLLECSTAMVRQAHHDNGEDRLNLLNLLTTTMNVKIKKLHPEAKTPLFATSGAVGADLFTVEETIIKPGELSYIHTGVAIENPEGHFVMIAPRSSLCLKKHLDMPNSVGIMDEDFRGEYIVVLRNLGNEDVVIEMGERIAQILFIPFSRVEFKEVAELSGTNRGLSGFGTTGKK
ncbi:MAG: dUTP diphosphatase [bacterium]